MMMQQQEEEVNVFDDDDAIINATLESEEFKSYIQKLIVHSSSSRPVSKIKMTRIRREKVVDLMSSTQWGRLFNNPNTANPDSFEGIILIIY